jgi:small subunit ribosomal protein S13
MAQENKEQEKPKQEKHKEEKKEEKKHVRAIDIREESLVRILSTDIPGSKKIVIGLTRIKGVSYSFSNAICHLLGLDKNRKVSTLAKEEIEKIGGMIKDPKGMPNFMLNRRRDFETGKNMHLTGADLDLQKEFDIKKLKKIRSYRGWRHATGQPTRGQRTKSHFRKPGRKKAVGVMGKAKPGKK